MAKELGRALVRLAIAAASVFVGYTAAVSFLNSEFPTAILLAILAVMLFAIGMIAELVWSSFDTKQLGERQVELLADIEAELRRQSAERSMRS